MPHSTKVEYDYVFTVILVGESGVGKTSIVSQYINKSFNSETKPTIGLEFQCQIINIENKRIRAQICDTAGQERYKAVSPQYYRNAMAAIIVYDISNLDSFKTVENWLKEIKRYTLNPDIVIMLVGNKYDLRHIRAVESDKAKYFAELNGLLFIETSASNSHNIDQAFKVVIEKAYNVLKEKILNKVDDVTQGNTTIKIESEVPNEEKKMRKWC